MSDAFSQAWNLLKAPPLSEEDYRIASLTGGIPKLRGKATPDEAEIQGRTAGGLTPSGQHKEIVDEDVQDLMDYQDKPPVKDPMPKISYAQQNPWEKARYDIQSDIREPERPEGIEGDDMSRDLEQEAQDEASVESGSRTYPDPLGTVSRYREKRGPRDFMGRLVSDEEGKWEKDARSRAAADSEARDKFRARQEKAKASKHQANVNWKGKRREGPAARKNLQRDKDSKKASLSPFDNAWGLIKAEEWELVLNEQGPEAATEHLVRQGLSKEEAHAKVLGNVHNMNPMKKAFLLLKALNIPTGHTGSGRINPNHEAIVRRFEEMANPRRMQTFTNPAGYTEVTSSPEHDPEFVEFMRQYGIDITKPASQEPKGWPTYTKEPVAPMVKPTFPAQERPTGFGAYPAEEQPPPQAQWPWEKHSEIDPVTGEVSSEKMMETNMNRCSMCQGFGNITSSVDGSDIACPSCDATGLTEKGLGIYSAANKEPPRWKPEWDEDAEADMYY
tara:strand:+ start:3483 stop:4988 length:1506 start_codon:yes stop_codon:yes gene_type:complete